MFSDFDLEIKYLKSNFQNFDKFEEYEQTRNNKSHKKGLEYIKSLQNSCFFCSQSENLVFLHKNPLTKTYEISQMSRLSQKSIDREVKKCWCVCKTCKYRLNHRLLTPLPEYLT